MTMRCIVCGGNHKPTSAFYCDEAGMGREIARMGVRKWNEITGQVMRNINRAANGESADAEKAAREQDGADKKPASA